MLAHFNDEHQEALFEEIRVHCNLQVRDKDRPCCTVQGSCLAMRSAVQDLVLGDPSPRHSSPIPRMTRLTRTLALD